MTSRQMCPNCGRTMRLSRTVPNPSGKDDELNVYKCDTCGVHFITEDHHLISGRVRQ